MFRVRPALYSGSVALYRKYRPATFAEVVGQEHVTEPLSTALDSGRINHAYLFSGPRGCGKTSSARILARSLNCVQGPTSAPCGECESCVALAPGGPGTLDVTELDAATHNGVDDMRELRDRAFYAPAESRFRVFIIDEAHMITSAGFNALLKIVEEPPEHLIFIFATTEPEKLLQTIRSRTHNYPFRLLTPPAMRGLLERVCGDEGVIVEDSVYPLVIRAGGGSPRDSLSIMDQLLAGSGDEGVTYERAVALLGFTDTALIDRAVDALAAQDQAGLFGCVGDVIDAGHDPRRFAMDLLDRFRDLLVVQAVPDAFDTGLVDAPVDQRDVLADEAAALGQATLTRCAALVNEGLAQMRGATAPRLLLEILCARMALPAAGTTVEALAQRIEALEAGRVSSGAGNTGGAALGNAGGSTGSSGRVYVRKSQREAQAAQAAQSSQDAPASLTPEPQAESTPQAAVTPRDQAADSDRSDRSDQSAEKDQSAPTARSAEEERRSEAERARQIMRRRRQAAAAPAASEPEPEPAQEPEPEPQAEPAQAAEPASAASEPASQSASTSSGHPVEKWDEILDKIHQENLAVWIAARDATATAGPAGEDQQPTILLQHHTGALANYINSAEHAAVFARTIEEITGTPGRVVAQVGSPPALQENSDEETEVAQEQSGKDEPAAVTESGAENDTSAADPVHEEPSGTSAMPDHMAAALQRAKRSETAHNPGNDSAAPAGPAVDRSASDQPVAPGTAQRTSTEDTAGRLTGWRARKARYDNQKNGQSTADQTENPGAPVGFGGVPLPEEPSEPWDDGPGEPAPDPEEERRADMAEAEEAMRQLNDPDAANLDHRNALEIAGELLEKHLGAERTR
jgi:DNA polymerase-3 subunit gamma/tau